jgi:hypothetical protein
MEVRKRVYDVDGSGGAVRESAQAAERPGGLELRAYRTVSSGEAWAWELEAGCGGEIRSLSWRREGAAAARASWRWEADSWVGTLEAAGGGGEAVWPMASGLQPLFPAVISDFLLVKRLALAPGSQRRLETLPVPVGALEAQPSHVLVDRLDERVYRVTDDQGRASTLSVDEAGWPSERRGDGGLTYRLVSEESV